VNAATREWLDEVAAGALLADGFEDAILGVIERCGQPPVVIYDRALCIESLIRGGLSREEAEEHFGFNVEGAWMGLATPGFLTKPPA
jgi:hypothetical protein